MFLVLYQLRRKVEQKSIIHIEFRTDNPIHLKAKGQYKYSVANNGKDGDKKNKKKNKEKDRMENLKREMEMVSFFLIFQYCSKIFVGSNE